MGRKILRILYLEDSPGDIDLFKEAIGRAESTLIFDPDIKFVDNVKEIKEEALSQFGIIITDLFTVGKTANETVDYWRNNKPNSVTLIAYSDADFIEDNSPFDYVINKSSGAGYLLKIIELAIRAREYEV